MFTLLYQEPNFNVVLQLLVFVILLCLYVAQICQSQAVACWPPLVSARTSAEDAMPSTSSSPGFGSDTELLDSVSGALFWAPFTHIGCERLSHQHSSSSVGAADSLPHLSGGY